MQFRNATSYATLYVPVHLSSMYKEKNWAIACGDYNFPHWRIPGLKNIWQESPNKVQFCNLPHKKSVFVSTRKGVWEGKTNPEVLKK